MWRLSSFGVVALCVAANPSYARTQSETEPGEQRGPRFLLVAKPVPIPVDMSRSPVLTRKVTLNLTDVTVAQALDSLSVRSGIHFVYDARDITGAGSVTLRTTGLSVAALLTEILLRTEVDVLFSGSGQAALVRRAREASAALLLAGVVAGRVTDAKTGSGVGGASVRIDGTQFGATTANDGQYRITGIPAGDHAATARRLGYEQATKRVRVDDAGTATADFSLTPVVAKLDAVVTTVTGDQRRREVGNVIGNLAADSLVKTGSITKLTDVLLARVSGVQVVLPSGFAGASPSIRVRGINSISLSNDPLLIVDGIRVANTTVVPAGASAPGANALAGGYGQTGGRLNDINPDEIESIDIVKGPSAATLYGTDAANGVVVIKTKRGSNGAPKWTAYGEVGRARPSIRFLDNYHAWGHTPAGLVRQCTLDLVATGACTIDSVSMFNAMEDPVSSPIGNGIRRQYGLQVSGGTNLLTYFLAAANDFERGYLTMPGIEQKRIQLERGGAEIPDEQIHPNWVSNVRLRGNASIPLGNRADVSLATGLVLNQTSIPGTTTFASAEWAKGYRDPVTGGPGAWYSGGGPGEYFSVRNQENVSHFIGSLSGNWRPVDWLVTRSTAGIDISENFLDALQRRGEGPLTTRTGRRQNTRSSLKLYSLDAGATAHFTLRPSVTSKTSVGLQYNRKKDLLTSATGTGLPPGSETITGAAVLTGAEQNLESVVAGMFVEQTLGWRDRLFVTGAVRGDGGSSFGKNFKTAVYPKVSASWLAIPNREGRINSLRLRTAYGASGVQPSSTAALSLEQLVTVFAEGTSTSGAVPSAIGNPSLKPERTGEIEAGFDSDIMHDRVSVELTYYNRLSHDALIQYRLPSEVSVPFQWRNIGAVRNRGVEGAITVRPVDLRDVALSVSVNGSYNWNRVVKLGFFQPFVQSCCLVVENYPIFSRFNRPILDYKDANGNGIIETNEITVGPNAEFHGPSMPPLQLSLTPVLALWSGQFTVSTQFDHRGGFLQQNVMEINRCSASIAVCYAANDPKSPAEYQARRMAFNNIGSTRWGFDERGTFTRWRELAISAQIPSRLLGRVNAKSGTLTVAGRNLALFTKYSGYDPEVNSSVGFSASGEGFNDNPTAPQTRYWMLRLNLGY